MDDIKKLYLLVICDSSYCDDRIPYGIFETFDLAKLALHQHFKVVSGQVVELNERCLLDENHHHATIFEFKVNEFYENGQY